MSGGRSWILPLLIGGLVIVALLGALIAASLSGGSSSDSSPTLDEQTAPSVVHEQGKGHVGDNDTIRVVLVDVNGRSVPCVLYDGYRAVAIDCLEQP